MTLTEKLAWLQANTNSFSIEVNEQRSYYQTVTDYLADDLARRFRIDDDVRVECERRNELVTVQCYPDTPVGFIAIGHWDIAQAVDRMHEIVSRQRAEKEKGR